MHKLNHDMHNNDSHSSLYSPLAIYTFQPPQKKKKLDAS